MDKLPIPYHGKALNKGSNKIASLLERFDSAELSPQDAQRAQNAKDRLKHKRQEAATRLATKKRLESERLKQRQEAIMASVEDKKQKEAEAAAAAAAEASTEPASVDATSAADTTAEPATTTTDPTTDSPDTPTTDSAAAADGETPKADAGSDTAATPPTDTPTPTPTTTQADASAPTGSAAEPAVDTPADQADAAAAQEPPPAGTDEPAPEIAGDAAAPAQEVQAQEPEQVVAQAEDEDDDDDDDDEGQFAMEDDDEDDDLVPDYDITLNGLNSYIHALELGMDLPTIDLTNQGIGDQGIIDLLEKLQATNKLSSVCTLKLDGNDIEAEGAKKLAECLRTNDTVTFLDLKWNMIGVEGTIAIGACLEQNSSLISLNLDGNELGEEGAIALAKSLQHNRGLKYLELKDNMLGDGGARALAEGLRGQPELVLLDLTSNDIGGTGACALSSILLKDNPEHSKQSALETLILNNNMISDEGAIALGDALHTNTTLHSLQLRKCGICAAGVMGITTALTKLNVTITELDLNNNLCGVQGEIALNDMMMNKPDLYVEWKDVTAESTWTIDEIQEIIQHYGVSEILSNILRGFSLVPLIENYKLLGALEIDDQETANSFVEQATSEELILTGLSMITTILNQGDDEDEMFDEYMMEETVIEFDELTPLLKAVHQHLPRLLDQFDTQLPEQENSVGMIRPLGETRLQILMFVTSLLKQNTSSINERLVELNTPTRILELMTRHQLNNILHCEVVKHFQAAFRTSTIRKHIICDGVLDKLMDLAAKEWERPQGERAGYSGHIALISQEVIKYDTEGGELHEVLQANESWQMYVNNEYVVYIRDEQWEETP